MYKRFKWSNPSLGRIKLTEQYEPLQPYLFVEFLRTLNAGIVLDVGANIGQYSIFSREATCVSKVYAFEAEKTAYDQMVANIELNDLNELISPYFTIVSSAPGELSFGVANPMAGNNAVNSTSIHDAALYKENRLLKAVALDDILNVNGMNVALKLDVEGHESEVLKGALNLLRNNRCLLQVEVYNEEKGVPHILSELGYKKLLAAGPDFYFSNLDLFADEKKILQIVEAALAKLIEYNLKG